MKPDMSRLQMMNGEWGQVDRTVSVRPLAIAMWMWGGRSLLGFSFER